MRGREGRRWRGWLWAGLAVFLVITVAGYVSPRTGASAQAQLVQRLFGLTLGRAHLVVIAARKLGHVLGYGFLGAVGVRLFRGLPSRKRYLFAALLVLTVAVIDEGIQSLLPWRSGVLTDVLLDLFAGLFGAGLAVARLAPRARGQA